MRHIITITNCSDNRPHSLQRSNSMRWQIWSKFERRLKRIAKRMQTHRNCCPIGVSSIVSRFFLVYGDKHFARIRICPFNWMAYIFLMQSILFVYLFVSLFIFVYFYARRLCTCLWLWLWLCVYVGVHVRHVRSMYGRKILSHWSVAGDITLFNRYCHRYHVHIRSGAHDITPNTGRWWCGCIVIGWIAQQTEHQL